MAFRTVVLLVICLNGLAACIQPEPGHILVSSPEVYTRERLVNDRLTNDEWLRDQLERAESLRDEDFGYQGLVDIRTFTGVFSQTGVQADPNLTALYGAETNKALTAIGRNEEAAQLEHQIHMAELTARLREAESEDGPATGADENEDGGGEGGSNGSQKDSSAPTPPFSAKDTSLLDDFLADLQNKDKSLLPDPTSAATTQAVGSPIDFFRDRLALREEIRSEIFENMLDDRHDIDGRTIYRLNFDATLIPNAGDDSWAIIEVSDFKVKEIGHDPQKLDDLYDRWKKHFVENLNELWTETVQQVVSYTYSVPEQLYRDLLLYYDLHVKESLEECELAAPGQENRRALRHIIRYLSSCTYNSSLVQDRRSPPETRKFNGIRDAAEWLVFSQLWDRYFYRKGLGRYFWSNRTSEKFEDSCTDELSPEGTCAAIKQNFADRIDKAEKEGAYVYAATPKESVQRISDVLATRNATQLALNLGLMLGSVRLDQVTRFVSETQKILHGIERQPLIVGFAGGRPNVPHAGWIIGPKFDPEKGSSNYSHAPIQNALSLVLSIPGWSTELAFHVRKCWRTRKNNADKRTGTASADSGFDGQACPADGDTFRVVRFREDLSSVTDLLDEVLVPTIIEHQWPDAVYGQRLQLLIPGTNLWRSTRVTLGPQISNRVVVLPDMAGIVAEFDRVQVPANVDGSPNQVWVRIWTSTGHAVAGRVRIHPAVPDKTLAFDLVTKRLITGEPVEFRLSRGTFPTGYYRLAMGVRVKKASGEFTEWEYRDVSPPAAGGTELSHELWAPKNVADGAQAQAGVFLQTTKEASLAPLTQSKTLVYYKSQETASIRAPALASNVKIPGPLVFEFPLRAAEAYPGFRPDNIKVIFKIEMPKTSTIKPLLKWGSGSWNATKRTLSGDITVHNVTPGQFAAAREGATLTVMLSTGNEQLRYQQEIELAK